MFQLNQIRPPCPSSQTGESLNSVTAKEATDHHQTASSNSSSSEHLEDRSEQEDSSKGAINTEGETDCVNSKSILSSFNGPAISANQISIMQDSTDLHWFNEEGYQRDSSSVGNEKNAIMDNSLLSSDSSTCGVNRYHALSRNIDATLAEIDMETFRSEDINNIYSMPMLKSQPVTEDGGEEYASVSGSLLEEIHSDSHYISSKRFSCHESDLNGSSSIFDSSLIEEPSILSTMRSDRVPGLISRSKIDISGVSVDSLDFSSSENDTNEMVLRCREQDKTKYTIAFEESLSSVTTYSDSNGDEDIKTNSEESYTAKYDTSHLRRTNDDFVKSEYTTWNQVKRRANPSVGGRQEIRVRKYPYRNVTKTSQSLPNIVQVASILHGDEPLFPPLGSYVPLYDLNKSTNTNSSNSEVSPPRSLIRLFIRNRVSPSSSSPGSSSTSFEGHFNDQTNEMNNVHSGVGPSSKFGLNSMGFQPIRDGNINYHLENNKVSTRPRISDDPANLEDSLVTEENVTLITPKAPFNRLKQASPIREEDGPLSDSSRGDEAIASGTDESNAGGNLFFKDKNIQRPVNYKGGERIGVAHRSISVDRFMNTQAAGPNTSSNIRRSSDYGSSNVNKTRFSVGREFGSVSSGYMSSRQGSGELHRKINPSTNPFLNTKKKYSSNVSVTTMKTASTQVPVHIQDKQVQTTIKEDANTSSTGFILREYSQNTVRDKEVPISIAKEPGESDKKPLYVCFPNYSLPDLSFLKSLSGNCTPNEDKPSTIYLSPTKLKLPSREVTPNVRRSIRKGVRPKSCTDYENMMANKNFNRIKDWDSLKVLLPNDFKSLIARLEGGNKTGETKEQDEQEEKAKSGEKDNPVKESSSPKIEVKFRPRKMVTRMRSLDGKKKETQCNCNERKRHSLQEPPSSGCSCFNDCCPCSNTLTRSVTMPSCICHTQICHHNSQPVHHQPACCQGATRTEEIFDMDPSVDRLCHLFSRAISVKDFTTIIGGGGVHHKSRLSSPSKPYAPIKEQVEETDSMYCNDPKENSDPIPRAQSSSSKTGSSSGGGLNGTEDNASFTELKKHWEALATSPAGVFTESGSIGIKKTQKSPNNTSETQNSVSTGKPKLPAKPALSTLRPTNQPVAKRPTSFGANGFKSMIPVAKGSKVSPPMGKLTSPSKIPKGHSSNSSSNNNRKI